MVTVVMTTWDDGSERRFEYAMYTLAAWYTHHPELSVIVADDGSPNISSLEMVSPRHFIVTGDHNGIGTSLERALTSLQHGQEWLYTTDDWLLLGKVDYGKAQKLLHIGYDVVRVGPIHPNLMCITRFQADIGWWLHMTANQGGYPFGTRPFLARYDVISRIGAFPGGVDSYEFENWFNERCQQAGLNAAAIGLHGPWEHIGEYEVGNRPVA